MAHTAQSDSLADLAKRLALQGPVKTMHTPRRIRILYNGGIIADTERTTGAVYVWEHDRYPQFYLPMEAFVKPAGYDIRLTAEDPIQDDTNNVVAGYLKLNVKRTTEPDTAYKSLTEIILFAADLTGPGTVLCNLVKVQFDAVGQWFEEDTPIYVHPKDPFKRVDILASSRPIRVIIDGTTPIATSQTSFHLYETSLPPRYYIPLTSIDTSLLTPSTTKSQCPYKGEAQYHSVIVGGLEYKDICWFYTRPTIECAAIAGMCCFYNEKVDIEIQEKGVWRRLERPKTHFA